MLAPKLPQGFGPYTLVQRLAQGGMAEVFLARQRSSAGGERNLVIKRILPHLAEDQEFLMMFQQEARLAMQLSHPNIVHTYDFGREGDKFYIALEYVDGPSLQTLLKHSRKPVPKAIAVRIACGVAAGLAYAHQATDEEGRPLGLVHRDVSPPNVLVARDGSVKLVDFGIAKALHRTPGTHSTTLKGKFAYMAPEQFDGEVTQRVDIYALGVCLYEMLSGEPLFRQRTVAELIRAVCASEIDPLSTRAPWVPEALEAIVMRALHRDPEQRYQSAETLLLVLERFLTQQGLVASPMLVGEWIRDTLAQPASKRKMPTLDDPPPSALDARESDPFDITAVRRQPAEPPRGSMAPPRDTMPQEFIVLSSHDADEDSLEATPGPGTPEVERTPVELTEPLAADRLQPPPPVRPTARPIKTPVPAARTRTPTPAPAAPDFEQTTSPRPVQPAVPEGEGTLDQAAARLAGPGGRKASQRRMAAVDAPPSKVPGPIRAPSPAPVAPAPTGYDDAKTIADPEARPPEDQSGASDTDRTLSLPPDRRPTTDPVELLARKLATIPDPTEPAVPAFPVRPAPALKAPAPTREPPRPVPKPLPVLLSPTGPAPRPRPATPAPAPAKQGQRETKPAPPPKTGPLEAMPAITTPLPRVTPQAPPMFTAKPAPAAVPAVGPSAEKTSELVTADLEPATPSPDAGESKPTLLRAPSPDPAATPPPAAAPGIAAAATSATPLTFGPVISGDAAKSRLEIPPELLTHTPSDKDSLTDVVSSAAILAPASLTAQPDLDNEATRVKVGSDDAAAGVGPTESLPAARVSEPLSMGPTVVLGDGATKEPVFSGSIGGGIPIQTTTERVLKPSHVVGARRRSMTGIVLGSLAVVLLAGSVALYFATISSNPGPPEEITREPANPPVEPSAESPSASTPAADAPVATPSNPTATPTPPVTAEPTTVAENTPTPPAPVQAEQPRDPTPRTPTLRDPTPRNPTPRDPTVRNPTPRNPTPREPTPGPRVAPAGGSARLFVNTEPWSHVLVGGRDLGTTPVANVEVPSGRVRLTLIDPDGHRFSRTVRVEPGEQKRVFFALQ